MTHRIVAIVQARMTSSRLPGKVLLPLGSDVVLGWVTKRARAASRIDGVLVATSDDSSDDVIEDWGTATNTPVFRGPLDDVLDRYRRASEWAEATTVVRLTADCPFVDPGIIDRAVTVLIENSYDYCSTSLDGRYPRGLDVEVMTSDTLLAAAEELGEPDEREHVTLGIYRRPERWRCGAIPAPSWVRVPGARVTLDEPDDFELATRLVVELGVSDPHRFDVAAALGLLSRRSDLVDINAHVVHRTVR